MKRKISFGLFIFFLIGQLSLPVFSLAAEPITGLKKVSEFKADDLLNLLNSKIDIKSFLGKPVKIPLTFEGGATDSIYLVPPQFFIDQKTQKITVTPTRTMYLADGKSVSEEKIKFVRDELEKELNKIMAEKKDLIEQLRAALLNQSFSKEQLQAKFKIKLDPEQSSWLEWFLPFVKAEDDINANTNIDIDALQQLLTQTQTSTGTATEGLTEDDALAEIISSDNPKSRELLSLLLLLLIYKNAIAEADNTDKTTCLAKGGEWIAEKCAYPETEAVSADEKKTCTESGGEWKSDFSQRKICMAFCGATDDGCTDKILEEKIGRSGCICPTGQCVTAAGDCLAQDDSKKDKDEDEIPDSVDKCPNTKDQGDGVNLNESSADYGCSCADLQAKGRIQQRQCPGGGCDGAYLVQYNQSSGTDSCQNGVISQFNCVANRYPSQQCQPPQNNNNNQNQNKNDNNSWQDMLKDLMGNKDNGNGGGQQGGGQQGGGDQGGGDQKSGCSSCGQQPQQTEQQKQEIERRINELPNLTEKDDEIFDKALEELNKKAENTDLTQEQYDQEYQRLRDEQFDRQLVELNRQAENTAMTQDQYDAKLQQIETQRDQGKPVQSETNSTSPDGSTTTTKYDPNGKQVETSTTEPSMWDYPQDSKEPSSQPPGSTKPMDDTIVNPNIGPSSPRIERNPDGSLKKIGDVDVVEASYTPITGTDTRTDTEKMNDWWSNPTNNDIVGSSLFDNNRALSEGDFDIFSQQAEAMRQDLRLPELEKPYIGTPESNNSLPTNPANDPGWGSYNDTNFSSDELRYLEKYYTGLGMSPEEIKELINSFLSEKTGPGDPQGAEEQEDKAPKEETPSQEPTPAE